jgi:Ca-activated chloride channel family protein
MLIVPFTLFATLVLTNKNTIERVFSKDTMERIKVPGSGISSRVRNIFFFIAIFFMIVAISHPYIYKGNKNITLKGRDIVLSLDLSASMLARDRKPSRLEFAKQKIKEFLNELKNDNVMLLTFGDSVFLISPFTDDIDSLKYIIDGIGDGYILKNADFTALANVLKEDLKNKELKIAVVVTDGGSKDKLKEFEKIILEENIKLFVILVGTKKGIPLVDIDNQIVKRDGKIVSTKVDEYIGQIAKESGGDYVIADNFHNGVQHLAKKIDSLGIGNRAGRGVNIKDRQELFYYPLIIASIFLILALFSLPDRKSFRIFKKVRK